MCPKRKLYILCLCRALSVRTLPNTLVPSKKKWRKHAEVLRNIIKINIPQNTCKSFIYTCSGVNTKTTFGSFFLIFLFIRIRSYFCHRAWGVLNKARTWTSIQTRTFGFFGKKTYFRPWRDSDFVYSVPFSYLMRVKFKLTDMECWCEYLYLIKIVFFRWRSIDEIYAIKPSFYPIVLILWTERE